MAGILLVLVTVLAYAPTFRAGFIWDDDDYVEANVNLRDLGGLADIWLTPRSIPQYYPLVHTTFWAEFQLFGLTPAAYHTTNVILHAGAALLLWRLLRRLEVPGAFAAALVWAVHPVNVESVAWVTERKNVLMAVFLFSALLVYPRFSGTTESTEDTEKHRGMRWRLYALSLLLFVCAMLSKTVAASFVGIVLVLMWWKRGVIRWRDCVPLIPFAILGALGAAHTAYLERTHVGAEGNEWAFSFIDRLLIASRALWFYAAKLALPINLSFIYPKWPIDPHSATAWLFVIGAITVPISLFALRKKISRGPLAAILIFGGTLLPALGFTNLYPMRYSFVADHFQYISSAALIAMIAAILARQTWVAFAPVIPLTILTALRCQIYQSRLTLWQDTLLRNPNSWMVNFHYGQALYEKSNDPQTPPEEKLKLQQQAFQTRLRARDLAPELPETHWNLGVAYSLQGDSPHAIECFKKALEINPRWVRAHNSLGLLEVQVHNTAGAIEWFRRAVELDPTYASAHYNLGVEYEKQRDLASALQEYLLAVQYDPGHTDARYNLANLLLNTGRPQDAIDHYRRVLLLVPNRLDARTNLGVALLAIGRREEAAEEFQTVLKIKPDFAPAAAGLRAARSR